MLFDRHLVSGTDGNMSMRVDNTSMLITPSGVNKGMLDPSMILHQSFNGELLEGQLKLTKEAEMHSKIYELRSDIQAVIHTHPACATAFAACGMSIPQNILIEVPVLLGKVGIVPYKKPGSQALANSVAMCAQEHDIILLQNHGVLTLGDSLINAFNKMDALENVAKTILYTKLLGKPTYISEEDLEELGK